MGLDVSFNGFPRGPPDFFFLAPRLAVVNPPVGCLAAPACVEEGARTECLAYHHDELDLVASYRRYYEWKRRIGGVDMRWSRRPHRRRWKRALLWICLVRWLRARVLYQGAKREHLDVQSRGEITLQSSTRRDVRQRIA